MSKPGSEPVLQSSNVLDTQVTMTKLVLQEHTYPGTNMLSGGVLLKWMDTVACLSSELLAHGPCVTASVDDMQLKAFPVLGNIVQLVARVNRAFNTSMEVGVTVEIDNLESTMHVCKVFFTFVEKRESGAKRRLRQVVPMSDIEKKEYNLAAERRKHRLNYKQKMKLAEDGVFYNYSGRNQSTREIVPADYTTISTELVLPPHANHHRTTFGGQIMQWIEQLAYIIASKVCRASPLLLAVDEIHFKNSSAVSDRISIKGTVNQTWSKTLEVGVHVEAYQPGAEPIHCNSAYLTYGCGAVAIPRLLLITETDKIRSKKALLRRAIRYERSAIRTQCRVYGKPWTYELAEQHCRNNTDTLQSLYKSKQEWEYLTTIQTSSEHEIVVTTLEVDKTLCFRAETTVPFSPQYIYSVIRDVKNRYKWDPNCQQIKILEEVGADSTIFSYNLKQRFDMSKVLRLLLLCSAQQPTSQFNGYTVAYTSLCPDNLEDDPKTITAELRCSGWVIKPVHSKLARRMTQRKNSKSRSRSNSETVSESESSYSDGSLNRGTIERLLSGRGSVSECLEDYQTFNQSDSVFSTPSNSETEEEGCTYEPGLGSLRRSLKKAKKSESCIVTYIIHTAETIIPYIARDIAGFGAVGVETVKCLHEYLLQNQQHTT